MYSVFEMGRWFVTMDNGCKNAEFFLTKKDPTGCAYRTLGSQSVYSDVLMEGLTEVRTIWNRLQCCGR